MEKKTYTVITGASQGLGKSFAKICAQQNHNLILIALPGESLNILAEKIKIDNDVNVLFYEVDLTKNEQVYRLISNLKNYKIDILINNAGVGGAKKFQSVSIEYLNNIMLLNMRSLVILTHQLLPVLEKQEKAYILNISSLAAFSPLPYKTVYPASKAFVYSFSRGLNTELKDTNVHVSVAHPGPMATNGNVSERVKNHKGLLKYSILPTDEVAKICLKKLLKKQPVIVPGIVNRFSSMLQMIIPVKYQLELIKSKLENELNN